MSPKDTHYERWLAELGLDDIRRMFRDHGAESLLCKVLPQNANSKNQIYVGSDISELGRIPTGDIKPYDSQSTKGGGGHGPIFRAPVVLSWITPQNTLAPAPESKFIVYPQYPEVRFSGFLKRCREAPSFLFDKAKRGATPDRLLFFGPRSDQTVLALAVPPESRAAREFRADNSFDSYGVFSVVPLRPDQQGNGRVLLLRDLCRIHRLGWIPSKRLRRGVIVPCNATNCGGYTLEAELGISTNGTAEPDFHGWEVKARHVATFEKAGQSTVTLFTPEPDGGVYVKEGVNVFIRTWGYSDTKGRADRLNFGGVYKCGGDFHGRTGTKLVLDGYDPKTGSFQADGAVRLVDRAGKEAASWTFAKLMDHWKWKHAQAAFVPYMGRSEPLSYRYGSSVLLGQGAEFRFFLRAVCAGLVYYDPGIKLEGASTSTSKAKKRSQFRVISKDLESLYRRMSMVEVCDHG
jgi:hypothetical protein